MRQFQFRLQRVLDWQRERCDLIENTIRQLCAEVESLQTRISAAAAALVAAEEQVLRSTDLSGSSLAGLASYRIRLQKLQHSLISERDKCELRLREQRASWIEARKRFRIMEKLKHRRQAEHSFMMDRELDGLAAEAYAARWHTDHAPGPVPPRTTR
jgi:flagellar export protein FliJ